MMKCKWCNNMQGDDNTGIDGYCDKCGSEDLEPIKEDEDYECPEYDMPMISAVEVANYILSKWD